MWFKPWRMSSVLVMSSVVFLIMVASKFRIHSMTPTDELHAREKEYARTVVRGGAEIPASHLPGKIPLSIVQHEQSIHQADVQRERLGRLHTFCDRHPEFDTSLSEHLKKHGSFYSINEPYRIIECRIAKTGTTFRGRILWNAYHNETRGVVNYVHPYADGKVKKLNTIPPGKVELSLREYEVYVFVREPIVRFISSYFDKIAGARGNVALWLKQIGWLNTTMPTLGQYFHHLAINQVSNEHFRGFIQQCNPCLTRYTFIARTESQTRDLEDLVVERTDLWKSLIGTYMPAVYKEPSANITISTPGVFNDCQEDDIRELIERNWAEYEAFGYNPDDILEYIKHRKVTDPDGGQ